MSTAPCVQQAGPPLSGVAMPVVILLVSTALIHSTSRQCSETPKTGREQTEVPPGARHRSWQTASKQERLPRTHASLPVQLGGRQWGPRDPTPNCWGYAWASWALKNGKTSEAVHFKIKTYHAHSRKQMYKTHFLSRWSGLQSLSPAHRALAMCQALDLTPN